MTGKKRLTAALTSAFLAVSPLASAFNAPVAFADDSQYDNYAKLLQYSLYFYDTNMCGGDVTENSAITWRDDCHTSDEVPGGFHDAGDHAIFGLPQGFTASTLAWSYYEFADAYTSTGQGEHLQRLTDRFCQFFKNSTILDADGEVSRFLYQKGDGGEDHSYWGAPENQRGNRKMFWTTDNASDIAAEYAAALAANYVNFGNAEDLQYAEALYRFSVKYNSVATDGPTGFYGNTGCKDEQAWAAGWLYKATGDEYYLNECASKQKADIGWVHGWESVDLGAACLYAEITGDWSNVNSYIGGKAQGSGYFFLDKWGSARLNCSLQFTALVAEKYGAGSYSDWCKGQMTYILGQNPKNICFVTGFAPNSAKNTHHRAASGYDGYWGQAEYDSVNGKTLIGALAGGPEDANGTYEDVMTNYVSNEVAIDYNAGLVGAAAGLYSVYATGAIDSAIEGVSTIYTGGDAPVNPVVTTAKPVVTTTKATTTTTKPTTTTVTTTKAPVVTAKPDGKPTVLSNVKLGETYDISGYSDISRIDVIFDCTPANGMNGCAVLGNWEYQNNYSADDLVNNTLVLTPNKKYNTMTIHKWYGDVNLKSVIIYTGTSADETTAAPATTTAKPTTTTTTTTTTAKPTTTTTTTTTAKPTTTTTTTTTAKPTTTTTTTTTAKPTTTTTTTTTAKPTTTTTTTTTAKPTTTTTTTTTAKPTTTTTTTTTAKPTTTTTTTTTAKPTTTTTTTTQPTTTAPANNTVVLTDVKYGEAYSLAKYNYNSLSKVIIKLSGDVKYGFGGNLVLGDWNSQISYGHTELKSDNTIELTVTNPQSKMTIFNYWGSMDLESVTLVF